MKIAEVLLYVAIYFTGAVFLFAATDLRLSAPLILWLAGYLVAMRYFIPRLGAHLARAVGRPLDHDGPHRRHLHQHLDGEDVRARRARGRLRLRQHERVPRHRAPAAAARDAAHGGAQRASTRCCCSRSPARRSGCGRSAPSPPAPSRCPSASCCACRACRTGSCGRSPGLFENVGVVQDGLETIARERSVVDVARRQAARRDQGRDPLRPHPLQLRPRREHRARQRHRGPQPARRAGREGRSRRPLGRRQVDAGQPVAALLRPRRRPRADRRAGHRRR